MLYHLVQYPLTDRRNEENLTPLPKAPDMGDSNGTMPNMSSGFAPGKIVVRYRWWIVGLWLVVASAALPFAPQASQILHSGGYVSPDVESQRAIDVLVQKLHVKRSYSSFR